ncbi:uncharacterized protein A4U43_C07F3720 [Asparagus officinalis]|uniref:Plant heme peroxidase family profile domain-containing protein n=1 Tax=Asparagus officinalis TaxID=4686 RepID=A0A5P1E9C4_ASPOF|nr:uncharacterized protein A4U43_C07F3720 [Asparagus officinalis]
MKHAAELPATAANTLEHPVRSPGAINGAVPDPVLHVGGVVAVEVTEDRDPLHPGRRTSQNHRKKAAFLMPLKVLTISEMYLAIWVSVTRTSLLFLGVTLWGGATRSDQDLREHGLQTLLSSTIHTSSRLSSFRITISEMYLAIWVSVTRTSLLFLGVTLWGGATRSDQDLREHGLQTLLSSTIHTSSRELLSGEEGLLQLPSDKALLSDPVFRPLVEKYAADEDAFFSDYAEAHLKLSELGFAEA